MLSSDARKLETPIVLYRGYSADRNCLRLAFRFSVKSGAGGGCEFIFNTGFLVQKRKRSYLIKHHLK